MKIIKYEEVYFSPLFELIHATIDAIYPLYYPQGVADFFHHHHSAQHLEADLDCTYTLLALEEDRLYGTACLSGNEIKRVFVKPDVQGRGVGRSLMHSLEDHAARTGITELTLSSTLAAYDFYLHLGYIQTEYNIIELVNNQKLCYFTMIKTIR